MPELKPEVKATYLAVWNEKENTLSSFTGDKDTYLKDDFKWEGAFTIPHTRAISDIVEIFVSGSTPPAIPDWNCVTPMPIDNVLRPMLSIRMIDVKHTKYEEGTQLFLINIMEINASSELIAQAIAERKKAETRNKILGGTPAGMGMPQGIPQGAMQISPEQLQQMINSGMIQPVGGNPMQPPQPKPSGIILK